MGTTPFYARTERQLVHLVVTLLAERAQASGPVTSRLRDLLISSLPTPLADRRLTDLQSWWRADLKGGNRVVADLRTRRRDPVLEDRPVLWPRSELVAASRQ